MESSTLPGHDPDHCCEFPQQRAATAEHPSIQPLACCEALFVYNEGSTTAVPAGKDLTPSVNTGSAILLFYGDP